MRCRRIINLNTARRRSENHPLTFSLLFFLVLIDLLVRDLACFDRGGSFRHPVGDQDTDHSDDNTGEEETGIDEVDGSGEGHKLDCVHQFPDILEVPSTNGIVRLPEPAAILDVFSEMFVEVEFPCYPPVLNDVAVNFVILVEARVAEEVPYPPHNECWQLCCKSIRQHSLFPSICSENLGIFGESD